MDIETYPFDLCLLKKKKKIIIAMSDLLDSLLRPEILTLFSLTYDIIL